ncbi:Glia maturation factor gamma [Chionoecetes opilio]|uniref:Glia maturation factor gamma n=1 Tax=Chionoecetes opilio TaxID=41210 RepID=A0A8J4YL65_CHIOP|nr:Glia maturation factor gamma [Chionoecetes opilio]
MSETPVVGSPVPEYELAGEDDEEEEEDEEARMRKKRRLLPISLPPADKGILMSPSYRSREDYRPKVVKFADGVLPGEGTSPSGGEEIHSPPPPTPTTAVRKKEKRFRKKRKVKVKVIKLSLPLCTIDPELKELMRKFRFRRATTNCAIIMKVNQQAGEIVLEDEVDDIEDVEALRSSIPDTQPRYVLISWRIQHSDGRVSFPMAFIFTTPRDCQPQLQMMYAGSYNHVVKECELTKVFQIRDLDELDEEWIQTNLMK